MKILLMEDNEGEMISFLEAFMESKIDNCVEVVRNPGETLDYLLKQNGWEKATTPNLIVLTLRSLVHDGEEILEALKTHPTISKIPVIALITMSRPYRQVRWAPNLYIRKSSEPDCYLDVVRSIEDFWSTSSKLGTA